MKRNEAEKKSILRKAAELYAFDLCHVEEIPGHEGGRNLVYKIGCESVLRVSTLSDRTFEDYVAEIEYIHYLSEGGASVADSIPSRNGNRVERIDNSVVVLFERAKGNQFAEHNYQYLEDAPIEEYFFRIGQVLGRMHALSKHYKPKAVRFDFFDKYSEAYFEQLIPDDFLCLKTVTGRQIKDALSGILEQLRSFQRTPNNYGMVHFDYSDGNYNIDYETGAIQVFDFDNCRTCWYLYDIANLWVHGLGFTAWNPDPTARRSYMEQYMKTVLEGYRSECDISEEELQHLRIMVNAVLMENIIDSFEVMKAQGEAFLFDEEESYNVKCLVDGINWFGFYSDIYDVEAPFEAEV